MTNQIQGEIIYGAKDGDEIFTPWMPVRGTYATFALEVLSGSGLTGIEWRVETRTRENSTVTAFATQSASTASAPNVYTYTTSEASGTSGEPAKELVRYVISSGNSADDATKFAMVRFLQPSWQVDGQ